MYDLQKLALPQVFLTRFPNAPDTQINRICKLNPTFIKKFPLTAERALILIQKNYREFKNIKIVPNPTYQITKKNLLKKIGISKILNSEEFQN